MQSVQAKSASSGDGAEDRFENADHEEPCSRNHKLPTRHRRGQALQKVKLRKDPRKHHEETVCPTVIPLEYTRLVPTTNIQLTGEAGASSSASERFRRREKACGVLPNCIESNLRSCMIVLAYMSAHAHAFDAMCEGIRNACFICRFDGLVCRTWSYM